MDSYDGAGLLSRHLAQLALPQLAPGFLGIADEPAFVFDATGCDKTLYRLDDRAQVPLAERRIRAICASALNPRRQP